MSGGVGPHEWINIETCGTTYRIRDYGGGGDFPGTVR